MASGSSGSRNSALAGVAVSQLSIVHTGIGMLTLFLLSFLAATANASPADTAAELQSRKYGIMVHFLGANAYDPDGSSAWQVVANTFDVDGLAQDASDAGAGWLLLTLGQNDGYWLAPNVVYDSYVTQYSTSRCAKRNVVNDLAAALAKRNIKLWIYISSECCGYDQAASNDLAFGVGRPRMAEFQNRWNKVISEWGRGWGSNVVAVFLDGVYDPVNMYEYSESPNFDDLANACRVGNSDRALMFNTGNPPPFTITKDDTIIAGELYRQSDPLPPCPARYSMATDPVSGEHYQVQWHLLTYLSGNFAGNGVPDAPRFSDSDVISYMQGVFANGGMITWDIPIQVGGPSNGRLKPGLKSQLAAIKACVRNGVCGPGIPPPSTASFSPASQAPANTPTPATPSVTPPSTSPSTPTASSAPPTGNQGVCGSGDASAFPTRCFFNGESGSQGRYVCCDKDGCAPFDPPGYEFPQCKTSGYVPPNYGT